MRIILFLIAAWSALAYTTPTGIPQPAWGAVDPVNVAAPAQPGAWPSAEAAGYYYIDNTHPSATDANTYGYPAAPRLTIPQTTYAAGSYCEIHGGPYIRNTGDSDQDITCTGTEANPCWFIGTSNTVRPEIRGQLRISGDYVFIQWIANTYDTANTTKNLLDIGGDPDYAGHVCVRNCTSQGDGTYHLGFTTGVSVAGLTGAETNNVVFYDCEMLDNDNYTHALTSEDDNHGMLIGQYTNNIWVLSCDIHNNSGDAIQVSGNNSHGEARAQYIYIGDNQMYHNAENAVDMKSTLDAVLSRNQMYDYVDSAGSDASAVVIQQEVTLDDGVGDGCDNVWVIFNHIYECGAPVRAEERTTNVYILGNLCHDITHFSDHAAIYVRTSLVSASYVDNTYARYSGNGWRWDNAVAGVNLHGNIFSGRVDGTGYEGRYDATPASSSIDRQLYDSAVSFRSFKSSTVYTTLAAHQAGTGYDANSITGDPVFASAATDNFNLMASSAAIGASTEHAAYGTFFTRYGLSIARDYNGNTRPQGGSWDIGACEYIPPSARVNSSRKQGRSFTQ